MLEVPALSVHLAGPGDILSASGGGSGRMFSLLQGLMEAVQLRLEGGPSPQDLCPSENSLVQGLDSRPDSTRGLVSVTSSWADPSRPGGFR